MDVCAPLGIDEVVVPHSAPVFSGYGLVQCDDIRTYSRSMFWSPGEPVEPLNDAVNEMTSQAREDLAAAGFEDNIQIKREARFKFQGQLYDQPVTLPDGDITEESLADIRERFPDIYEEEYGAGTAWETPVVIQSLRVIGTGKTEQRRRHPEGTESYVPEPVDQREVFLPIQREYEEVDVYDPAGLQTGATFDGTAIVEGPNMTMVVPDDCSLTVDPYGHYKLERTAARDEQHTAAAITEGLE
jgi:N-methylhydantoinase A